MSRKWIRIVEVDLTGGGGGITVGRDPGPGKEPLTIAFSIEATVSGVPNAGTVEIWNLSKNSRNSVGEEWDALEIRAGHRDAGNVGIIGRGFIRDVEHRREQVDIVTKIEFGDGDKAWREGTTSRVVSGTPEDQVRALLEDMPEVDEGDLLGLDGPAYKRPVVLYGPVSREMSKLSRTHGFYWSVQNGVLETIPRDGYIDQEAIISPQTGMIGVPTLTDAGIKVRTLLDPQIRPNRVVRVISETLEMNTGSAEGRFRVDRAQYEGDNRFGPFEVAVEGTRVE